VADDAVLRGRGPRISATVAPEWRGETVAVIASGPSLTREQVEQVRGRCRVIAVNNTAIDTEVNGVWQPAMAPWADVLYAADAKWWHCYKDRALAFPGPKYTVAALPFPEVLRLQKSHLGPFDERPTHLCGGNSGHHALHLAVHFGAARILLLGFDMRNGLRGERHYHGNHPPRLHARPAFATWINQFRKLAPELAKRHIEVVNCSPSTALTAFRRASVTAVLNAQ
jgi:hypothetical protein